MLKLQKNDIFRGKSHVDLVNNVLRTNMKATQRCGFKLPYPNNDTIVAWFVFMDGSIHGMQYESGEEYKWANTLVDDGNTINEEFCSDDFDLLTKIRCKNGFLPYRLAFQLDPYHTGDRYTCRFAGVFCLDAFYGKNNINAKYVKVLDSFDLLSLGDSSYNDMKDTILANFPKYNQVVDKSFFDDNVQSMIKSFNKLSDYLELGLGVGEKSISINNSIRRYLSIENKTN